MTSLIWAFLMLCSISFVAVLLIPNRITKQVKATKAQRVLEAQQDAEFESKRERTQRILEEKRQHRYDLAQFDLEFFNALPETKPLILCEECSYLSVSSHPHSPSHCSGVVDSGQPERDDVLFIPYVQCQCPYCNPGGTSYVRSYQR